MKNLAIVIGMLLVVGCADRHCPPAPAPRECPTLPIPCPSMVVPDEPGSSVMPLLSASSLASSSTSAIVAAPQPPPAWESVTGKKEIRELFGTWIHETNGDSHATGKLNYGGVRVVFAKGKGKTPYTLRYWAPKPGHDDSKTVSGGCGFYDELHDTSWFSAFCRGYGLPTDNAVEVKLFLERDPEQKKLRVKIGDIVEAILVRK